MFPFFIYSFRSFPLDTYFWIDIVIIAIFFTIDLRIDPNGKHASASCSCAHAPISELWSITRIVFLRCSSRVIALARIIAAHCLAHLFA